MKLVKLLAKELETWAITTVCYVQDPCGSVWPCKIKPNFDGCEWIGDEVIDQNDDAPSLTVSLSSDYASAVVTKSMWQAERDRQKGGEWNRHRGGKQPVADGVLVEVKLRDGDIQKHYAEGFAWPFTDCDVDANILKYRVISQPQAEEVEVSRFVGKDVQVEYAFSQDGVALENLDWKPIGKCKVSNIEFDSEETEEERVKDTTVGTLTYKVDIDTGPAMQTLNDLSAKWDQVESPFKWRDEVTELNAYIEKFTRERDELINRLASEGFALIPAMTPVMGVADVDFSDWRNWQSGDIVECLSSDYPGIYTKGNQYTVEWVKDDAFSVFDDIGGTSSCDWLDDEAEGLKFVRRP